MGNFVWVPKQSFGEGEQTFDLRKLCSYEFTHLTCHTHLSTRTLPHAPFQTCFHL